MKLLHCDACGDVVRLFAEDRSCHCGRSSGRYVNDTHVLLRGPSNAIGVDTGAVANRDTEGTWHVSENVIRVTS